jgi:O-antigen/teichoic acid export membrane protein
MVNRIIKRLKNFNRKKDNKELVRHSFVALIMRIAGAIIAFAMNVVVARLLGAEESGYFFLAVTFATLLATVGRVGADQTVLRFVSIYGSENKWNTVHAVMRKIMSWSVVPLLAITAIVCMSSELIANYFFHKPALAKPLFFTALSMPLFAAYNVYGMALQARKKVLFSVAALKVLTPFFLILIIFIWRPETSMQTAVYYLVSCGLNLLFAFYWWKKMVPAASEKETFDSAALWKSSGPLWVTAIMNVITTWGGQFIAGIFTDASDVAQLSVCRNTTVLISFILMAVNNVSAPRFAVMYKQGDMAGLKKYAIKTTRLMSLVALPITAVLWIFPEWILSLFGEDFLGGAQLLRILATGQLISVCSGSVGYLLNMTGHEKDMRNVMVVNASLSIILALILTPLLGAVGSALATALAVASTNLMAIGFVKKRLGFSTLGI